MFREVRAPDCRDASKIELLPDTRQFGAGFSCVDKSKRRVFWRKTGTTGNTFDCVATYIIAKRPLVSFLENVPEVESKDTWDEQDESWQSDADYIVNHLQEHDFTVFTEMMSAVERGSPKCRKRWWAIVSAIAPPICQALGARAVFNEILAAMKHEQVDPKAFMFADDILEKLQDAWLYGGEQNTAKKAKEDWVHHKVLLERCTRRTPLLMGSCGGTSALHAGCSTVVAPRGDCITFI